MGARHRRTRAAAATATALLLAAVLGLGPRAQGQAGLAADEWEFLKDVVGLLRDGDGPGLAQRTDFPSRLAEGLVRGTARRGWDDLDELGRLVEMQATTEGWVGDRAFLRGVMLYHARPLADPDAGQGPVPDRRIYLAVLKSASRELRDLMVVATPGLTLIDLVFGEAYFGDLDPDREPGVAPEPLPALETVSVAWPDAVDSLGREEVLQLVETLLASDSRLEQDRTIEFLHRNPHAGVTALVTRLLELGSASEPDAAAEDLLVRALERITGRSSSFTPVPRWGQDEGAWRAANEAEIAAWGRWQQSHGARFQPAPIPETAEPTFAERAPGERPAHLARTPGEPPVSPATVEPPTAQPPAERAPADPGASEPAEPDPAAADPAVPRPVLRPVERAPDPPAAKAPSAEGLEILWGSKRRTVADVGAEIPPGVRAVLDAWAPAIEALGLTAALSGNPDHLVLGLADDELLAEAARSLDEAWEVIDPLVPTASGRRPRPTVALLFDRRAHEPALWDAVVDALLERRVVTDAEARELRAVAVGLTAPQHPLFLQPVWDLAGSAAAGDDEFRLGNELAHKLAQCMLAQRCGSLPEGLRWSFGYVIENRLFDSVYQFNRSGFVATGDHFDWPVRARQILEKSARRRDFSLSERLLAAADQEHGLDTALVGWAVLETLAADEPETLAALLQDLADIHAAADPYGLSSTYRGDAQETEDALAHRLAELTTDEIVAHLGRLD